MFHQVARAQAEHEQDVFPSPLPVSTKSSNKLFQQAVFECAHHLGVSPPLKLHSDKSKLPLVGP